MTVTITIGTDGTATFADDAGCKSLKLTHADMLGPSAPNLYLYVGSGCYAAEAYSDAVSLSRAAFDMGADQGFAFNMLDIGGGSGAYSINVVQAHSEMTAVVFDLPPVAEVATEFLEQNGVDDRVVAFGGDFTADPFPDDCDVAVMASNLPIYDAGVIGSVVAKTHEALLPGGEMHLIGEMLDDDRSGPADAAMWGMNELMYGGQGRAHTIAECIGYFQAAGFSDIAVDEFIPGVLKRVSGVKHS